MDGVERKNLVRRRVEEWRAAIDLQDDRLTRGRSQERADLHLYAVAVGNLSKAVTAIICQYRPFRHQPGFAESHRAIREAARRFRGAVPDASDVRNMLEHFDAYDHGVGILQKKGDVSPNRMGTSEKYWFAPDPPGLEVLGRRLMVAECTPAASELAEAVLTIDLPKW
jgi:hypothetical protein